MARQGVTWSHRDIYEVKGDMRTREEFIKAVDRATKTYNKARIKAEEDYNKAMDKLDFARKWPMKVKGLTKGKR